MHLRDGETGVLMLLKLRLFANKLKSIVNINGELSSTVEITSTSMKYASHEAALTEFVMCQMRYQNARRV